VSRLSIGLRLTLWYLGIFLLAELVFGAGMWLILRENLYDITDDALQGQAGDLKRFLEARQSATLAQLQSEISEDYKIERSEDYLQIRAEDGSLIYRSNYFVQHPLPDFAFDASGKARYEDHKVGKHRFRFFSQRVDAGGRAFLVQIGSPLKEELETLDDFQKYLLMFVPLLLLAASIVGYWLSRKALAPVDALTRTARNISGHNLSSRLQKLETGDELQRLSDTLNEMLARIESAFLRVTQFTADASHELRTPVALIRTEAELALRRSRDENEYREALQHILQESDRTTKLIEELLTLARADSGREALDMRPIDLLPALREVAAGWRQVAALRSLRFEEHFAAESLRVLGDESALRRVVGVLLDNAFKYTSAPGAVTLSVEQKDSEALIRVEDTGIGIAGEDQPRIFERFYRVDKARSRNLGGSGLGLAIAQWIVQLHRGSITVESKLGSGSLFQVKIPTVKAPADQEQAIPR